MGRVWRPGQRATRVFTYRLLSALTLEERMYQRQQKKLDMQSGVVATADVAVDEDEAETFIGDENYLEELFTPSSSTWSDTFESQGHVQSLEAPPSALLRDAAADGHITHVHFRSTDGSSE